MVLKTSGSSFTVIPPLNDPVWSVFKCVKCLDVHISIAFCEDPRKAGEMIHFRDNTKKNREPWSSAMVWRLRRKILKNQQNQTAKNNQMSESRPGSNITQRICAILLCDFCDTSQVSNAPKEKRTLGQILILVRNTDCSPKSKTLRWNNLCFSSIFSWRISELLTRRHRFNNFQPWRNLLHHLSHQM